MMFQRSAPAVLTLLLHATLAAAIVAGLSGHRAKRAEPVVTTVELLAPPVEHVAPAPQASAPMPAPPAPPPKKARQKPKAVGKPKPPPQPKPSAAEPAALAPAARPEAKPAPPSNIFAAPPPAAAPAPPAKTGVSIPASYAASNRKPDYPALSRRYDEQGTVVLRVLVTAEGAAGAVEIKSSSGYARLDEAARSAVQAWRFHPATSDGKPVSEWYQLAIPFKLQD